MSAVTTRSHPVLSHPVLSPPVLPEVPPEDVDAVFQVMFHQHRHRLYSTALRLTGSRSDAEDLAAETFLQAYRALAGFDAPRIEALRARAWLSTILVNQWRNQRRTASRRPVLSHPPPGADVAFDPEDPRAGVEARAEGRDDARVLASLLTTLPERQREALVLRYIGDLPLSEIAEVMGCPVGTVKSHISRGLCALRPARGAPA